MAIIQATQSNGYRSETRFPHVGWFGALRPLGAVCTCAEQEVRYEMRIRVDHATGVGVARNARRGRTRIFAHPLGFNRRAIRQNQRRPVKVPLVEMRVGGHRGSSQCSGARLWGGLKS